MFFSLMTERHWAGMGYFSPIDCPVRQEVSCRTGLFTMAARR